MFARSFLVVFGLVIIASIATAFNFPEAVQILRGAFPWANLNCLYTAANICQTYWNDRQQFIYCSGQWLQSNKGQCMVG